MGSAVDVGRELEQLIARYFGEHGYRVTTNRIVEGRSGGRHEIDVLAERSDALTNISVAIECKAWQQPIEKDVVSKLHYVLTDAGLNKGILVSLGGSRAGADRTAADLGIDIWGPDELRHHLGDAAFAAIGNAAPRQAEPASVVDGWGFQPRASASEAERVIRSNGKGRFGLRTVEELVWFSAVWVPVHCVTVSVAQPTQRRFKAVLQSSSIANLYDALGGSYLGAVPGPWEQVRFEGRLAVPPLIRDTKVPTELRRAYAAYQKVSSPSAIERHAQGLRAIGLPTPCSSMTIEATSLVHLPVYVGILEARGQLRAEAIDARTGAAWPTMSNVLTTHLAHLRTTFAGP